MYIREKKNNSGSTSIQIISKDRGCYKVVKTVGSAITRREIDALIQQAKQEIEELSKQTTLFSFDNDCMIEQVFSTLQNSNIRTVGPEIIFGKIYDYIGFGAINQEMFRHLVLARLAFPLSKLKTIEYLYRYQGVMLEIDAIIVF